VTSGASAIAAFWHQDGLAKVSKGRVVEGLRCFGEALAREETCERWNDWAAAAFMSGGTVEAEHGFRRALELAPEDGHAAENLGLLLMEQHRFAEALPYFARAMNPSGVARGTATSSLLEECTRQVRHWLAEFEEQVRTAPVAGVETVHRWPLTGFALRMAQLGQFEDALEMVNFNRHFQPRDLALRA
jgi:tetratricopeptide (TPR) repeat protein